MLEYLILIYLVWFVKAPWWLYVPCVTGVIFKGIYYLMQIYQAGKESK